MTRPRLLVVEHEAGAPAAWFGEAIEAHGAVLEVRRPYAGDELPDLAGHDGLLVLGGAVDSWDDAAAPWLPRTRELVLAAEANGVPALGICLGHQIAVAALGGEVGRNPSGSTVAVLSLGWLEGAPDDPLFAPVSAEHLAVHWNNDVAVRLPPGARVLARSPDGQVQAARLGRHVWGVQFHPEAGPAVLDRWVAEDGEAFLARGIDLNGFLADAQRFEDELANGCRQLAESFARLLDGVRR